MSKPDRNYRSFADETGETRTDLHIDPRDEGLDPADFDDLLKISHCRTWTLDGFGVFGGGRQRENAIDLNRACQDVMLANGTVEAGKQNAITIKGGCVGTTLHNIVIVRPGGNSDIELGNHSDQSQSRTTGTILSNVTRSDGKPLRVRGGNADWPIATGTTRIRRQWFRSLKLKIYVAGKRRFPRLFP